MVLPRDKDLDKVTPVEIEKIEGEPSSTSIFGDIDEMILQNQAEQPSEEGIITEEEVVVDTPIEEQTEIIEEAPTEETPPIDTQGEIDEQAEVDDILKSIEEIDTEEVQESLEEVQAKVEELPQSPEMDEIIKRLGKAQDDLTKKNLDIGTLQSEAKILKDRLSSIEKDKINLDSDRLINEPVIKTLDDNPDLKMALNKIGRNDNTAIDDVLAYLKRETGIDYKELAETDIQQKNNIPMGGVNGGSGIAPRSGVGENLKGTIFG